MPIIITAGIILPNGRFLPNYGDGHSKNADRFCREFPLLDKLKDSEKCLNSDEFMIAAGCAIVADYYGRPCFKVGKDNSSPIIRNLIVEYEKENYTIESYLGVVREYCIALDKVLKEIPKMEIVVAKGAV